MKNATFPIVLIALGSFLLLHSLGWVPNLRWLWIVGLILAGVVVLVTDGITKSSVVVGPLLILAGALQYFRLTYDMTYHIIIPILLIALGVLLLIARSDWVPEHAPGKSEDRDSTPPL
ncbi:MAG: hypothetical protein EPO06_02795 [Burkholderiaceae bacterium]|nr:MAG: hypothetical protein EPO06_02795 [Burkholderiaceae bacterium]